MCNSLVQATAGEEEDEEGAEDEECANLEKERASLMHATSGSGMHAIEVRLCTLISSLGAWGASTLHALGALCAVKPSGVLRLQLLDSAMLGKHFSCENTEHRIHMVPGIPHPT